MAVESTPNVTTPASAPAVNTASAASEASEASVTVAPEQTVGTVVGQATPNQDQAKKLDVVA